MAKKTTKTRRDARPRLNQAQLQAYRTRKAETIIASRPLPESPELESQAPAAVTTWGRVDDEYAMIAKDLWRLLLITALMLAIIVVLWFVLG